MNNILFLADMVGQSFRTQEDKYTGGAELTDMVAAASCPWRITHKKISDLDIGELFNFDLLILSNSQSISAEAQSAIINHGRYILFEHDVRICDWRGNMIVSPDFNHWWSGKCECPHTRLQPLFRYATGIIFLTNRQKKIYESNPFFTPHPQTKILGCSLFEEKLFDQVFKKKNYIPSKKQTVILYSTNQAKGFETALTFCHTRNISPTIIHNFSYEKLLNVFSESHQCIFLPEGPESAGRVPVEARLLGCDIVTNQHVGVEGEKWWKKSKAEALDFLKAAPDNFWNIIRSFGQAETLLRTKYHNHRVQSGSFTKRLIFAKQMVMNKIGKRLLSQIPGRRERITHDYRYYEKW